MISPNRILASLLFAVSWFAITALPGCAEDELEPMASARVMSSRNELIGGNRALADVGDFVLENDQVRLVIQTAGYSRGFGVYGGGIIDADLRRPTEGGDSGGGDGSDAFSELFPAFFLEATAVDNVEILSDGSDGGAAVIRASGYAGDFLTMAGQINRAVTGSHTLYQSSESDPTLRYENIYELAPGDKYVTIRFRVTNISDGETTFPSQDAYTLLGILGLDLSEFTVPIADVALFGDTSDVFVPGAGFDTRTALDDAFKSTVEWPAFPGIITEWVASKGMYDQISYGFLAAETEDNFVYGKQDFYGDNQPITQSSVLIPFISAGMLGIFHTNAPAALGPGESFEVTRYFILGSGDVGSVLDTIHEIQNATVGRVGGLVIDEVSGQPAVGASVLVYQRRQDGSRRIFSQYTVHDGGFFRGTLEPGEYSARVAGTGRQLSEFVDFRVAAGQMASVTLMAHSPGRVTATVVNEDGVRLPAKVSVVGTYDPEYAGADPREFLFDLQAGEGFRWSDLEEDSADDASTRRYIENHGPTDNGSTTLLVRPGDYTVVISRGPEYDIVEQQIQVGAGQTATVGATLHRVVDTTGWIAADLHVHSQISIDSSVPIDEKVRWVGAEGIEWVVATDHNFLTDYTPYILRNGLESWMISSIGVELSTLEAGHFNGYPLNYDLASITRGSFEWSNRPPQEIFDELRSMGAYGPDETIVQVNHPRDTIQGYFAQYRRDALTGDFVPPSFLDSFLSSEGAAFYTEDGDTAFSYDFDAVEVLTHKRLDLVHHYRVPEVLPEGEIPEDVPPAGTILMNSDGEVAYPGTIDDWYNFLNLGYRYIAVGNSDSHEGYDEVGYPRNLIYVGEDNPAAIHEREMIAALQSRHVVVTTGPFLDFYINNPVAGAMGQMIVDSDGQVSLTIRLTAAPWMGLERINVVRNGLLVHSFDVDPERDLSASPIEEVVELPLATDVDGNSIDSWFVVETIGSQNLFPVVLPLEIPPLVLSDALASLGSAFGFGANEYGDLQPPAIQLAIPYALTNPIWVKVDDGDFDPPGPIPYYTRVAEDQDTGFYVPPGQRLVSDEVQDMNNVRYVGGATPINERPPLPIFHRDPSNPYDVRRIFDAWGHGH